MATKLEEAKELMKQVATKATVVADQFDHYETSERDNHIQELQDMMFEVRTKLVQNQEDAENVYLNPE
jgi:hypothetical protein